MPGYVVPGSRWMQLAGCAVATVGDTVIILALWGFSAVVFRDLRWFEPPRLSRYAVVIVAAIVVNAAVEWIAVDVLRVWSYSTRQPIVPWLGTGLFAVLQALVLPPVTFLALARWERMPTPERPRHCR